MTESAKPDPKTIRDAILDQTWGDSPLAFPRPQLRAKKTDKPVTADCYATHIADWCGSATPKRRGAE